MGKIRNPNPPPPQFFPGWKTGKTKAIKFPIALETDIRAIAKCLDANPAIASQVIEFAQSLLVEQ